MLLNLNASSWFFLVFLRICDSKCPVNCKRCRFFVLQLLWGFAWLCLMQRVTNMITVMNGELERTQMVLRLNPQVHLYGSTSPVFSGLWKIYGCPDTLTSSLKHLLLKKLWHWWRSAIPKSFTYSDKMTRPFPFDFMEFCDKIKRRPSLWQMHYMPRRCEWDWSFFFEWFSMICNLA